MRALLEARELTRHYPVRQGLFKKTWVRALNGVSLRLEAGQTLAIVGESGCGKSTLARLLALLDQPTGGALQLFGKDPHTADKATRQALRAQVQMVFQNPYASLNPRLSIQTQLEEPLKLNTTLNTPERRSAVLSMLEQVGLSAAQATRYAHEFSGGQRQRIAIARAMMLKPALVIADEPTAALDVSIQAQVLNLFQTLQSQYNTAFVFISHNLPVVRYIADQILVMYLGRVVESGPSEQIYQNPQHPYTQTLLAATPSFAVAPALIPVLAEPVNPTAPLHGCAFAPRCPRARPLCREQTPLLRSIAGIEVACHEV